MTHDINYSVLELTFLFSGTTADAQPNRHIELRAEDLVSMPFYQEFLKRRSEPNQSMQSMKKLRTGTEFRGRAAAVDEIQSIIHDEEKYTEERESHQRHRVGVIPAFSGMGKTRLLAELPLRLPPPNAGHYREFVFVTYNSTSAHKGEECEKFPAASTRLALRLLWAYFCRDSDFWLSFCDLFRERKVGVDTVVKLIAQQYLPADGSELSLVIMIDEFQREAEDALQGLLKELLDIACAARQFCVSFIFAGLSERHFNKAVVGSSWTRAPCYLSHFSVIDALYIADQLVPHLSMSRDLAQYIAKLSDVPALIVCFLQLAYKIDESRPALPATLRKTLSVAFESTFTARNSRWQAPDINAENMAELLSCAVAGTASKDAIKWQDKGFCLLASNLSVQSLPYALLMAIDAVSSFKSRDCWEPSSAHFQFENASMEPLALRSASILVALRYFMSQVDQQMNMAEPWLLLEKFGVAYHALRLLSFYSLGHNVIMLKELLPGAAFSESAEEIASIRFTNQPIILQASALLGDLSARDLERLFHRDAVIACASGEPGFDIVLIFHDVALKNGQSTKLVVFDQRKRTFTGGLVEDTYSTCYPTCLDVMTKLQAAGVIDSSAKVLFGVVNPIKATSAQLTKFITKKCKQGVFAIGCAESPVYHRFLSDHPIVNPIVLINASEPSLYSRKLLELCLPAGWGNRETRAKKIHVARELCLETRQPMTREIFLQAAQLRTESAVPPASDQDLLRICFAKWDCASATAVNHIRSDVPDDHGVLEQEHGQKS